MPTYKTPDVYVEEISQFPPSVAEVETAVPAFIGYTEKASHMGENLLFKPTRVTSMLEYHEWFGAGPKIDIAKIELEKDNSVKNITCINEYLLYDSIRLAFGNGVGNCFIVSIGTYQKNIDDKNGVLQKEDFEKGINTLLKEDDPTLILFPDAINLEGAGIYDLQQRALAQCNKLMDRFVIMDMLECKKKDPLFSWQSGVKEFRNKVGINNLKYGAVYTPHLVSSLTKDITYRDTFGKIFMEGETEPIPLKKLTFSGSVMDIIERLEVAIDKVDLIFENKSDGRFWKLFASDEGKALFKSAGVKIEKPALIPLNKGFELLYAKTDTSAKFILEYIYLIMKDIKESEFFTGGDQDDEIASFINEQMKDYLFNLPAMLNAVEGFFTGMEDSDEYIGRLLELDPYWSDGLKADDIDTTEAEELNDAILGGIKRTSKEIYDALITKISNIKTTCKMFESNLQSSLEASFPVFNNIKAKVIKKLQTIPPSGIIAGVYASVDSSRGVWKAPANISLNNVLSVTHLIDNDQQASLNVDVTGGKSINAIRPFQGKGILVWGARTLMGNDNEWRYISVRRFFNMVEESVKKSTYWAVFEPNDANLWIKLKVMIENYLTQKWKDGALAGSSPDQAFYVNVGLGATMSAQDILEGRLYVDIGMAVVRPAEFIILRFMHKMQES